MKLQTQVPYRLEPFGGAGWSVALFASAELAAGFVQAHPQAAMPCWRRFDVIAGALVLVR